MFGMRRRQFIKLLGGVATALPLAARAQQPVMPVVGFLSTRSAATDAGILVALRQGLSESSFVEGRNLAIEYRYAEGQIDRLPSLAADLVRRQVTVIVATGGVYGATAAKAATANIPIVFTTAGDPVKEGLVQSLNRPGNNLTGVTTSFAEAGAKRLELLREIVPKATAINSSSEANGVRAAARLSGQPIEVLQASTEREIDAVFATLINARLDGLLIAPDAFFGTQVSQLVTLAARHAIPTLYWRREFVDAGGLVSYGSHLADALRLAGIYAGRILKGEKPRDLPVQQPTRFELVINLKTAKVLGLEISPMLLARADQAIE